MFTGLVTSRGRLVAVRRMGDGSRVEIEHDLPGGRPAAGESIAVDGVCLTVTGASTDRRFTAEISPETILRTGGFERWRGGREVNLERALQAGDRIGGHLVQGHADGTLRMLGLRRRAGGWIEARFELPPPARRWVVEKGSVALNGVSLTVARVGGSWFEVALIPATLSATTLGSIRPGERLVVEYDLLAKYAGQAASNGPRAGGRS